MRNETSILYLFYLFLFPFFIYFLFSKWLLVKLMYLRNSFVQFSVQIDMLQHNLLHKHIYPLFRFDSGIRVASMSNVDSIPFLIGVLIFLWECRSFLIIKMVILNSFPTGAHFVHPKLSLFFPHPPTLFFLEPAILK